VGPSTEADRGKEGKADIERSLLREEHNFTAAGGGGGRGGRVGVFSSFDSSGKRMN